MTDAALNDKLSRIFRAISPPARLQILMAIGKGEACVCHLEALLKLRQAYISQHLMELRQVGLLDTRRDGRYIFYRVTEPRFLDLLAEIGHLFGIPPQDAAALEKSDPLPRCDCPDCTSQRKSLISDHEITSQN